MTPNNGCVIDGIPNEWETKRLHQVAEIRSGVAKNSNIEVSDPILVHYLRVANVQDGYLDLSEMSKIEISRSNLTRFAVLPGDVLMNEGGDLDQLGRGALWQGQYSPCVHQNHVFVVRCGRSVTAEFLSHWTGSETAKSYFLVGGKQTTNLASINKTALGLLPVAVPPPDEQRAIAGALSDVDALLGVLDRMLTKKRDLKQAAMQQLLTGQTRLPGFKAEWEEKTLGEMGDFKNGINKSKEDFGFGHPFANLMDVFGIAKVSDTTNFGLVNSNSSDRDQYDLLEGDVLFVRSSVKPSGVGLTTLIESDLPNTVFSGFLLRYRESTIATAYKEHCFFEDGFRKRLIASSTVSANTNINQEALKSLALRFPPTRDEQTAIAEVLSDMDAEIAALEQRREKTRALKVGMMQVLLTGKVRLIGK